MQIFVKLDGPLGDDLGPYFTLTPNNSGSIDPSIVTKDQLLDGVYVRIGNFSTSAITITSVGKCKNSITLEFTPPPPQTTTTTTTINPAICFNYLVEGGDNIVETINPGVSPALYNGKVWYTISGNEDIVVYWNNTEWVLDFDGLGGGSTTQTLDNNNNSLPISDSTYQWTPECVNGSAGVEICSTTLGVCPTTTSTTTNPCAEPICGETYEGYAYLYNWYSIGGDNGRATGGIVKIDQPGQTGNRNLWRVPTDDDWTTLTTYLGGESVAGGKLKTICTIPFNTNNGLWTPPNTGATNEVNWAGVPGGYRANDGPFNFIGDNGYWWSSTEDGTNYAWSRFLNYGFGDVYRFSFYKTYGFSVRLVRPVTTEELSLADGTTSTQNPSLPKYLGNNNRYYVTVKIGNQVWMAQNLLETIYNDTPGNLITEVTNPTTWAGLTTGARCSYNNNVGIVNGDVVPCTPQLPDISCGTSFQYDGNMGYPLVQNIELGTDTGVVNYNFNAFGAPDRFIVKWNGGIVIDSGYRGNIDFDFGGGSRSIFITSLLGKTDPVTNTVYPDFTNFPDDGYPRVTAPGNGTMSFTKNLAAPTFVTVEVYAPNFGTGWAHTMNCPIVDIIT